MKSSQQLSGSSYTYTRVDIKILVWFVCVTVGAIILRYQLFPFTSQFMQSIADIIPRVKSTGFISVNDLRATDNSSGYIYLATLFSFLSHHTIVAIKLLNTLMDVITALGVWAIVQTFTAKKIRSILAYSATLLLPSLIMSSGLWGQSESVVLACIVWMLYALLKGRYTASVLLFACALTIKWWALFLAPLLLMWSVSQKRGKSYQLLLIPLILLAVSVPSLMNGQSFSTVALSFINGLYASSYQTSVVPSLHALISGNVTKNVTYSLLETQGSTNLFHIIQQVLIGFSTLVCLGMIWIGWIKKFDWNWLQTIRIALFSSIIFPFLIPNGQSRYFILASLLALLYGFISPKHFWYVLVIELCALVLISSDVFGVNPVVDTSFLIIALCVVMGGIGYDIVLQFQPYKTLQQKVASLSQKYLQSQQK